LEAGVGERSQFQGKTQNFKAVHVCGLAGKNIVKISILPNFICKVNANPIKIQMTFFRNRK
jgi:hypothetical protein